MIYNYEKPFQFKAAIPASQFLRLWKICSEDDDLEESATTMESFFVARGYPVPLVREGSFHTKGPSIGWRERKPDRNYQSTNGYHLLSQEHARM